MRTHFTVKLPFDLTSVSACGRGRRIVTVVSRVDCLNCRKQDAFLLAVDERNSAIEADFAAQTPRHVPSMFNNGNYSCHKCGGDLFRERPRSLFSFHFVCEGCGTSMFPPTETGMCQ